jgi:predicted metal-dependent enzyme (double-stranded beta helix superfamily)
VFDIDQFLADCREAGAEPEPRRAIHDVLERAMAEPDEVAAALHPTRSGFTVLDGSPDLTVLHVVWAPHMVLYPHDHLMWAAIGIYTGQEDNAFYRRSGPGRRTLDESGGRQVGEGEVLLLGDDAIHGVTNPRSALTGAIHIYGGDFVNKPRSQWGPGPREERPYDMDEARRQFIEANEAWRAADSA